MIASENVSNRSTSSISRWCSKYWNGPTTGFIGQSAWISKRLSRNIERGSCSFAELHIATTSKDIAQAFTDFWTPIWMRDDVNQQFNTNGILSWMS
jgi:hypothetical protein